MGMQLFQCMLNYHFSHFALVSQYKPSLACNTIIIIGLKIILLSLQ